MAPDSIQFRQPILEREEEKAPFTVKTIKQAIPRECFERELLVSFSHLFKDLFEVFVYGVMFFFLDYLLFKRTIVGWVFSLLCYTFIQGTTLTGLWVLAHECGHGAFTKYSVVNDTVGYIVHTMLLVPYFSWQRTHATHHMRTNNLDKDEVWVPSAVLTLNKYKELVKDNLIDNQYGPKSWYNNLFGLIIMSTLGWPLYIAINATSHATEKFASHFLPSSSLFKKSDYWKVVASTIGFIAWVIFLGYLCIEFGTMKMVKLYFLPLVVVFFFLTSITYLQHTDDRIPHYNDKEWTWLRGALCTVDRTMGKFMDNKLHLIHRTHVCHHMFPKIPFYHSMKATKAIQKVVGEYYIYDDSSFMLTLWRNYRDCNAVVEEKKENNESVFWWYRKEEEIKKNQ